MADLSNYVRQTPTKGQAAFRNIITNGDVLISQRGATFTNLNVAQYIQDRWILSMIPNSWRPTITTGSGGAVGDASDGNNITATVATAKASPSAGDYVVIVQRIEADRCKSIVNQTFSVSFWAKSNITGTYFVSIRNSGVTKSYLSPITISSANVWTYITIKDIPSLLTASALTWSTWTSEGLSFSLCLGAGSSYTSQTTFNQWITSNNISGVGQTNLGATLSNNFSITDVQIEPNFVTPFERRQKAIEHLLCRRYFEVIKFLEYPCRCISTAGYLWTSMVYSTEKRVAPTIAAFSGITPQYYNAGWSNAPLNTTSSVTTKSAGLRFVNTGASQYRSYILTATMTVDSEL